MSSHTPKPARQIWAWWTLVAVSSIWLLALLALNLYGWNRTRALRIELASAESREEARQLAKSATEFINDRLDDLHLLGTLLHRIEPSRRAGAFKRDARGMIQHEASFILVAYMDENGLFAASVPKKGVGLRDESGTVRIPDEASGAANALQTGVPWSSGLFLFKQHLPALAIACPVFNDTGDQCQGVIAGILDIGLAMRRVLESRLSNGLDARLFLHEIEVASSSSEPERAIFWAQPVRATMQDRFANAWSVASWPKESHPLMRLEYDSIFRLGVNLFYSMLLWMLLVYMLFSIRRLRRSRQRLRDSEERYTLAVSAGKVGVWDARIETGQYYADALAKMLGFSAGELGTDLKTWLALVPADDRKRVLSTVQKHLDGVTPRYECEHRMTRKDGSTAWLVCAGSVVERRDGRPVRLVGTSTDITERKAAEEARRKESERAQRYLDIAGVVIIALDTLQRVTLINRKGCEVLGYREQDLLGANWIDLCLPERLRPAFRDIFEHIIEGQINASEYIENPVLTRSGEERLIAWHNILLRDDSGAITGLLASGEDVTERRHAQEEAKQREQQLIQADKMASLGVLVSGVAHEINNPNAFILTNTSVLDAAWKNIIPILDRFYEEQGDFLLAGLNYSKMRDRIPVLLAGIRDGARRIKLTVEELRGYAQHEPPGLIEPVNINDVVKSASTLLGNMIRKSTSRFTIQGAEDLPTVQGSFRRLEQVVINLIQNSCQALTCADQAITVSTAYDAVALRVLLTVHDEGAGMSEEVLSRIKDPFFTTKRESGGTGLGLSISEKIIRDHGGSLSFASEPGHGTRATISLPAFAEVATIGEEQL